MVGRLSLFELRTSIQDLSTLNINPLGSPLIAFKFKVRSIILRLACLNTQPNTRWLAGIVSEVTSSWYSWHALERGQRSFHPQILSNYSHFAHSAAMSTSSDAHPRGITFCCGVGHCQALFIICSTTGEKTGTPRTIYPQLHLAAHQQAGLDRHLRLPPVVGRRAYFPPQWCCLSGCSGRAALRKNGKKHKYRNATFSPKSVLNPFLGIAGTLISQEYSSVPTLKTQVAHAQLGTPARRIELPTPSSDPQVIPRLSFLSGFFPELLRSGDWYGQWPEIETPNSVKQKLEKDRVSGKLVDSKTSYQAITTSNPNAVETPKITLDTQLEISENISNTAIKEFPYHQLRPSGAFDNPTAEARPVRSSSTAILLMQLTPALNNGPDNRENSLLITEPNATDRFSLTIFPSTKKDSIVVETLEVSSDTEDEIPVRVGLGSTEIQATAKSNRALGATIAPHLPDQNKIPEGTKHFPELQVKEYIAIEQHISHPLASASTPPIARWGQPTLRKAAVPSAPLPAQHEQSITSPTNVSEFISTLISEDVPETLASINSPRSHTHLAPEMDIDKGKKKAVQWDSSRDSNVEYTDGPTNRVRRAPKLGVTRSDEVTKSAGLEVEERDIDKLDAKPRSAGAGSARRETGDPGGRSIGVVYHPVGISETASFNQSSRQPGRSIQKIGVTNQHAESETLGSRTGQGETIDRDDPDHEASGEGLNPQVKGETPTDNSLSAPYFVHNDDGYSGDTKTSTINTIRFSNDNGGIQNRYFGSITSRTFLPADDSCENIQKSDVTHVGALPMTTMAGRISGSPIPGYTISGSYGPDSLMPLRSTIPRDKITQPQDLDGRITALKDTGDMVELYDGVVQSWPASMGDNDQINASIPKSTMDDEMGREAIGDSNLGHDTTAVPANSWNQVIVRKGWDEIETIDDEGIKTQSRVESNLNSTPNRSGNNQISASPDTIGTKQVAASPNSNETSHTPASPTIKNTIGQPTVTEPTPKLVAHQTHESHEISFHLMRATETPDAPIIGATTDLDRADGPVMKPPEHQNIRAGGSPETGITDLGNGRGYKNIDFIIRKLKIAGAIQEATDLQNPDIITRRDGKATSHPTMDPGHPKVATPTTLAEFQLTATYPKIEREAKSRVEGPTIREYMAKTTNPAINDANGANVVGAEITRDAPASNSMVDESIAGSRVSGQTENIRPNPLVDDDAILVLTDILISASSSVEQGQGNGDAEESRSEKLAATPDHDHEKHPNCGAQGLQTGKLSAATNGPAKFFTAATSEIMSHHAGSLHDIDKLNVIDNLDNPKTIALENDPTIERDSSSNPVAARQDLGLGRIEAEVPELQSSRGAIDIAKAIADLNCRKVLQDAVKNDAMTEWTDSSSPAEQARGLESGDAGKITSRSPNLANPPGEKNITNDLDYLKIPLSSEIENSLAHASSLGTGTVIPGLDGMGRMISAPQAVTNELNVVNDTNLREISLGRVVAKAEGMSSSIGVEVRALELCDTDRTILRSPSLETRGETSIINARNHLKAPLNFQVENSIATDCSRPITRAQLTDLDGQGWTIPASPNPQHIFNKPNTNNIHCTRGQEIPQRGMIGAEEVRKESNSFIRVMVEVLESGNIGNKVESITMGDSPSLVMDALALDLDEARAIPTPPNPGHTINKPNNTNNTNGQSMPHEGTTKSREVMKGIDSSNMVTDEDLGSGDTGRAVSHLPSLQKTNRMKNITNDSVDDIIGAVKTISALLNPQPFTDRWNVESDPSRLKISQEAKVTNERAKEPTSSSVSVAVFRDSESNTKTGTMPRSPISGRVLGKTNIAHNPDRSNTLQVKKDKADMEMCSSSPLITACELELDNIDGMATLPAGHRIIDKPSTTNDLHSVETPQPTVVRDGISADLQNSSSSVTVNLDSAGKTVFPSPNSKCIIEKSNIKDDPNRLQIPKETKAEDVMTKMPTTSSMATARDLELGDTKRTIPSPPTLQTPIDKSDVFKNRNSSNTNQGVKAENKIGPGSHTPVTIAQKAGLGNTGSTAPTLPSRRAIDGPGVVNNPHSLDTRRKGNAVRDVELGSSELAVSRSLVSGFSSPIDRQNDINDLGSSRESLHDETERDTVPESATLVRIVQQLSLDGTGSTMPAPLSLSVIDRSGIVNNHHNLQGSLENVTENNPSVDLERSPGLGAMARGLVFDSQERAAPHLWGSWSLVDKLNAIGDLSGSHASQHGKAESDTGTSSSNPVTVAREQDQDGTRTIRTSSSAQRIFGKSNAATDFNTSNSPLENTIDQDMPIKPTNPSSHIPIAPQSEDGGKSSRVWASSSGSTRSEHKAKNVSGQPIRPDDETIKKHLTEDVSCLLDSGVVVRELDEGNTCRATTTALGSQSFVERVSATDYDNLKTPREITAEANITPELISPSIPVVAAREPTLGGICQNVSALPVTPQATNKPNKENVSPYSTKGLQKDTIEDDVMIDHINPFAPATTAEMFELDDTGSNILTSSTLQIAMGEQRVKGGPNLTKSHQKGALESSITVQPISSVDPATVAQGSRLSSTDQRMFASPSSNNAKNNVSITSALDGLAPQGSTIEGGNITELITSSGSAKEFDGAAKPVFGAPTIQPTMNGKIARRSSNQPGKPQGSVVGDGVVTGLASAHLSVIGTRELKSSGIIQINSDEIAPGTAKEEVTSTQDMNIESQTDISQRPTPSVLTNDVDVLQTKWLSTNIEDSQTPRASSIIEHTGTGQIKSSNAPPASPKLENKAQRMEVSTQSVAFGTGHTAGAPTVQPIKTTTQQHLRSSAQTEPKVSPEALQPVDDLVNLLYGLQGERGPLVQDLDIVISISASNHEATEKTEDSSEATDKLSTPRTGNRPPVAIAVNNDSLGKNGAYNSPLVDIDAEESPEGATKPKLIGTVSGYNFKAIVKKIDMHDDSLIKSLSRTAPIIPVHVTPVVIRKSEIYDNMSGSGERSGEAMNEHPTHASSNVLTAKESSSSPDGIKTLQEAGLVEPVKMRKMTSPSAVPTLQSYQSVSGALENKVYFPLNGSPPEKTGPSSTDPMTDILQPPSNFQEASAMPEDSFPKVGPSGSPQDINNGLTEQLTRSDVSAPNPTQGPNNEAQHTPDLIGARPKLIAHASSIFVNSDTPQQTQTSLKLPNPSKRAPSPVGWGRIVRQVRESSKKSARKSKRAATAQESTLGGRIFSPADVLKPSVETGVTNSDYYSGSSSSISIMNRIEPEPTAAINQEHALKDPAPYLVVGTSGQMPIEINSPRHRGMASDAVPITVDKLSPLEIIRMQPLGTVGFTARASPHGDLQDKREREDPSDDEITTAAVGDTVGEYIPPALSSTELGPEVQANDHEVVIPQMRYPTADIASPQARRPTVNDLERPTTLPGINMELETEPSFISPFPPTSSDSEQTIEPQINQFAEEITSNPEFISTSLGHDQVGPTLVVVTPILKFKPIAQSDGQVGVTSREDEFPRDDDIVKSTARTAIQTSAEALSVSGKDPLGSEGDTVKLIPLTTNSDILGGQELQPMESSSAEGNTNSIIQQPPIAVDTFPDPSVITSSRDKDRARSDQLVPTTGAHNNLRDEKYISDATDSIGSAPTELSSTLESSLELDRIDNQNFLAQLAIIARQDRRRDGASEDHPADKSYNKVDKGQQPPQEPQNCFGESQVIINLPEPRNQPDTVNEPTILTQVNASDIGGGSPSTGNINFAEPARLPGHPAFEDTIKVIDGLVTQDPTKTINELVSEKSMKPINSVTHYQIVPNNSESHQRSLHHETPSRELENVIISEKGAIENLRTSLDPEHNTIPSNPLNGHSISPTIGAPLPPSSQTPSKTNLYPSGIEPTSSTATDDIISTVPSLSIQENSPCNLQTQRPNDAIKDSTVIQDLDTLGGGHEGLSSNTSAALLNGDALTLNSQDDLDYLTPKAIKHSQGILAASEPPIGGLNALEASLDDSSLDQGSTKHDQVIAIQSNSSSHSPWTLGMLSDKVSKKQNTTAGRTQEPQIQQPSEKAKSSNHRDDSEISPVTGQPACNSGIEDISPAALAPTREKTVSNRKDRHSRNRSHRNVPVVHSTSPKEGPEGSNMCDKHMNPSNDSPTPNISKISENLNQGASKDDLAILTQFETSIESLLSTAKLSVKLNKLSEPPTSSTQKPLILRQPSELVEPSSSMDNLKTPPGTAEPISNSETPDTCLRISLIPLQENKHCNPQTKDLNGKSGGKIVETERAKKEEIQGHLNAHDQDVAHIGDFIELDQSNISEDVGKAALGKIFGLKPISDIGVEIGTQGNVSVCHNIKFTSPAMNERSSQDIQVTPTDTPERSGTTSNMPQNRALGFDNSHPARASPSKLESIEVEGAALIHDEPDAESEETKAIVATPKPPESPSTDTPCEEITLLRFSEGLKEISTALVPAHGIPNKIEAPILEKYIRTSQDPLLVGTSPTTQSSITLKNIMIPEESSPSRVSIPIVLKHNIRDTTTLLSIPTSIPLAGQQNPREVLAKFGDTHEDIILTALNDNISNIAEVSSIAATGTVARENHSQETSTGLDSPIKEARGSADKDVGISQKGIRLVSDLTQAGMPHSSSGFQEKTKLPAADKPHLKNGLTSIPQDSIQDLAATEVLPLPTAPTEKHIPRGIPEISHSIHKKVSNPNLKDTSQGTEKATTTVDLQLQTNPTSPALSGRPTVLQSSMQETGIPISANHSIKGTATIEVANCPKTLRKESTQRTSAANLTDGAPEAKHGDYLPKPERVTPNAASEMYSSPNLAPNTYSSGIAQSETARKNINSGTYLLKAADPTTGQQIPPPNINVSISSGIASDTPIAEAAGQIKVISAAPKGISNTVIAEPQGIQKQAKPDMEGVWDAEIFHQDITSLVADMGLGAFYPPNDPRLLVLSRTAATLTEGKAEELNTRSDITNLMTLALFDKVFYLDDSRSMVLEDGRRIKALKALVEKVTKMLTAMDPTGIKIRFMNALNDGDHNGLRDVRTVRRIMSQTTFDGRYTRLGKILESKILEPLVFRKIANKTLTKPILITIVTDGKPSGEKAHHFRDTILKCQVSLKEHGYDPSTVIIQISQVGDDSAAQQYLRALIEDPHLASMIHGSDDTIDKKMNSIKAQGESIQRWLLGLMMRGIRRPEVEGEGISGF